MTEQKITETDDIDNNDDMLANEEESQTVSFKVSESAAPQRGWTKKEKYAVWIIATVITVLAVIVLFFLKIIDFSHFTLF